jgi:hypothetical protein
MKTKRLMMNKECQTRNDERHARPAPRSATVQHSAFVIPCSSLLLLA